MAKLIIEIEIPDTPASEILTINRKDWFPRKNKPDHVSIDEAYLERDPTEDSFFSFKLIEVKE